MLSLLAGVAGAAACRPRGRARGPCRVTWRVGPPRSAQGRELAGQFLLHGARDPRRVLGPSLAGPRMTCIDTGWRRWRCGLRQDRMRNEPAGSEHGGPGEKCAARGHGAVSGGSQDPQCRGCRPGWPKSVRVQRKGDADDLVGLAAARRVDVDGIADLLADQGARDRRADRDLAGLHVGLRLADDLVELLFLGVVVDQLDGGAELDRVAGRASLTSMMSARPISDSSSMTRPSFSDWASLAAWYSAFSERSPSARASGDRRG
jgi:hypothetical protein